MDAVFKYTAQRNEAERPISTRDGQHNDISDLTVAVLEATQPVISVHTKTNELPENLCDCDRE